MIIDKSLFLSVLLKTIHLFFSGELKISTVKLFNRSYNYNKQGDQTSIFDRIKSRLPTSLFGINLFSLQGSQPSFVTNRKLKLRTVRLVVYESSSLRCVPEDFSTPYDNKIFES